MFSSAFARLPRGGGFNKPAAHTRRVLLHVFFFVFFLLGFGYHILAWRTQQQPAAGLALLYNLLVLACYGSLWVLVSYRLRKRHTPPARTLWSTFFLGVLLIGLGYGITQIGGVRGLAAETGGFNYETNAPLTLATVFKMNLFSLVEAIFVFVLLLRFRDLVLFKRTKSSQRNWYLMLVLMMLAALVALVRPQGAEAEDTLIQAIPLVPAVVFMVINSFRLSWIVQLSFKEKMANIGLLILLLTLLVAGMAAGDQSLLPGTSPYLTYYSYPLSIFAQQAIIFGILYCTTALLSLLFHLPTTGDFQRKADEMAAMHSLTHLVNQVFDAERLVSTITASPVEAGSADAAWLAMADVESGSMRPRVVATHNLTPALVAEMVDTAAFYEEVLATHEPLLLDQAAADHRVEARPGDGFSSLLVAPLVARDEMLGALFVTREVTHGFEKDDVEAIAVFAAQAALALDNARLFAEQIDKERLARELAIAREVQHKLLPQSLPALEGVTLAASSVSAQEVGGDYYDFVQLDDRRLAFIVGDVSGKGTSAAFYMAEMQGVFHSVSFLAPDPRDFLIHANRALSTSLEKNVFISVIYGVLDLETEEVCLARAGHCPAALINLNGEARFLRPQGMGLGLDRSGLFARTLDVVSQPLQPGDVFVLYTDGVVESRNRDGEEYGYERLLEALREHRHEDAPDLHASLLANLDAFLGGIHQYDDDLTLVVLKWHGIDLVHAAARADGSQEKAPAPVAALE